MHLVRTLSGLTAALAVCLAGCASNSAMAPSGSPQFVAPSPGSVSGTPSFAAPSSAPASSPTPSPSVSASRKASPSPSKSRTPSPKASTTTTAAATSSNWKYAFPVKASNVDYHPTHSKYPATDIFADCGEPVVATTSGVVLEVSLSDTYVEGSADGPANGGLFVSIRGDDGVRYYGSHLSRVTSGIRAGVRVTAGQSIGKVGKTGNANNVCHLHYGISPPCAGTGDWKVRRGVVWPASFLDSWRSGSHKSPVATAAAWKRSHSC